MNQERIFGPGSGGWIASPPPAEASLPRTSLPVLRGAPRHLDAHLHRLEAGALAMGQSLAWVPGLQADIANWLDSAIPGEDAAFRMILHPNLGLLSARLEPLPEAPNPCRLAPAPHPMCVRRMDPILVHKGLAGPWWTEVLSEAHRQGADDALLLWPDGTLAETAIASVGLEQDGILRMPPPQGRVASLAERLDLPGWVKAKGLQVERGDIPIALAREGQLWCMNALRGIWAATLL